MRKISDTILEIVEEPRVYQISKEEIEYQLNMLNDIITECEEYIGKHQFDITEGEKKIKYQQERAIKLQNMLNKLGEKNEEKRNI